MKGAGRFYAALAAVAVALVTTIVAILYASNGERIPGWNAAFAPGSLSLKHGFLSGKCEACHTPTQGPKAATCIGCHANAAVVLGKQSTAFHTSVQNCNGCHAEHRSSARPTKMDHQELMRAETDRNGGSTGIVGRLHDISGDFQKLIRMPESSANSLLECAACHSNRDPHRGLFGRECGACHSSASWRISQYRHPSASSKDCAQCHQAPPSHYMEHFVMVSETVAGRAHTNVRDCFLCHRTDSFNDIAGVGWYKHH